MRALGLDFGGVIAQRATDEAAGFFGPDPLSTPPTAGAFEAVSELVGRFEGRVSIVSKAGRRTAALTREWLHRTGFHRVTGVPAHHVHFCAVDNGKVEVCRSLEITHFVDDTPRVLELLSDTVPHRFLFEGSWPETLRALEATLG